MKPESFRSDGKLPGAKLIDIECVRGSEASERRGRQIPCFVSGSSRSDRVHGVAENKAVIRVSFDKVDVSCCPGRFLESWDETRTVRGDRPYLGRSTAMLVLAAVARDASRASRRPVQTLQPIRRRRSIDGEWISKATEISRGTRPSPTRARPQGGRNLEHVIRRLSSPSRTRRSFARGHVRTWRMVYHE